MFKANQRMIEGLMSRLRGRPDLFSGVGFGGHWGMRCKRNGEYIWEVEWDNLVVTVGRNYLLEAGLSADATAITTWYLGLVSGASPTFAAGDTMSSHGGWTEATVYDEATRVAWVPGSVSNGSVSNAASVAEFTMNDTATIGGAFLVSNNTKGGTTGVLYAAGDFATDRSVIDNDILEVTATFSATAA